MNYETLTGETVELDKHFTDETDDSEIGDSEECDESAGEALDNQPKSWFDEDIEVTQLD